MIYQIGALDGLARTVGGRVRYVKPHGALYNACVDHEDQARAVVEAVRAYDRGLPILGLRGSALLRIARERRCARSPSTSSTATTPPTAGWSTAASPTP